MSIIFIRHGESVWNSDTDKRFTGWEDIPVTEESYPTIRQGGDILLQNHYEFDYVITSTLTRSIITAWHLMHHMNQLWRPEIRDWQLNPRHYGALQGMSHTDAIQSYGQESIKNVRGDFNTQAPILNEADDRNPRNHPAYQNIEYMLPLGESYADLEVRVNRHIKDTLEPLLQKKKKVLVVAHDHSLKILIKYFQNLSEEETVNITFPPGKPFSLTFEKDNLVRFFIEG